MNEKVHTYKLYIDDKKYLCLLICMCFFLLSGCSSIKGVNRGILENAQNVAVEGPPVDLSGYTLPQIPESLQAYDSPRSTNYATLPYVVEFEIVEGKSKEFKNILKLIKDKSILLALQKQLPRDRLTLEKRIEQDLHEAQVVLHSYGYYSAKIEPLVDYSLYPVQINFLISPHEEYKIIQSDILYSPEFLENMDAIIKFEDFDEFPQDLFSFGLERNAPATANSILEARAKLKPWFVDRGFPFAELSQSNYYAYPENATFRVEVPFSPNQFIRFGNTVFTGSTSLSQAYLDRITPWEKGEVWNQSELGLFQEELLSMGIFSFVNPVIDENSIGEERDVIIELVDAPPRTWGGGVNYDITRGLGAQLFWEHRNLFSEAETFNVNTVAWYDTQELRFRFTKPNYQEKYRDFKSEFLIKNEMTDAYDTISASLDIGIEDRILLGENRRIIFSYYASFELGIEKDAANLERSEYFYGGMPLLVIYKNEDSIFDPSHGHNIHWTISPYIGEYFDNFSLLWTELMLTKYFDIFDNKKLILALKGRGGMLSSYSAEEVPASLRFYVGGGNSVRGYSYQSVGPKNNLGDPIGGASFLEGSAELRWKILQSLSLVPFFDFGNVYENAVPDAIDFKYSAGLGVRFFTPIGPLRFDVAVPIEERTLELSDFQLYVSIGQSF